MPRPYPNTLAVTRKVLEVLVGLNLLGGVLILFLLIATVIAEGPVMGALGVPPGTGSVRLMGMRLIMVLGIASVPLTNFILTRLQAIVATVGLGDPFVAENAGRLARIAWAVLGLELMHLAVGGVAAAASSESAPLDIGWSFSIVPWLGVLLLFVLARVFEQGTRMRDDLEGTV